MNPLLILAAIVVMSTVLNPAVFNTSDDNAVHSGLINKSSVDSSVLKTRVIIEELSTLPALFRQTPLTVSEMSDETSQHKDKEARETEYKRISQKATEMLVGALLRSGQCEIINQVDFWYLSEPRKETKGGDLAGKNCGSKTNELGKAKYFIRGMITDYGCGVISIETPSESEEKQNSIKYARARAAIDLRITDARTAEITKTLSMRDEIIGQGVESGVFRFSEGEISYEVERKNLQQQAINMVLSRLINSMVDELVKSEIFKLNPLLMVTIEGVVEDWAEETSIYLARKLLENNIGVTLEIIPINEDVPLRSSSNLVTELKKLYLKYPNQLEFALQGLKDERHELEKSLQEQVRILSQAQAIFAQAFNKESDKNKIFPITLVPPYWHYNEETFQAAKLVGLKIIIAGEFQKDDQGFTLLENGIIEIKPDEDGNLVNDWVRVRIRPVKEIISSLEKIIGKSETDPLVLTINSGALFSKLGERGAERYIDQLVNALNQLRGKYDAEFTTATGFYESLNLLL